MEFQLLLDYLGKQLGLDTLSLNENGVVSLKFGDDITVHLEPDPKAPTAHLYSPLCKLNAATRSALLEPLLIANAFGRGTAGAFFSIDEPQQEVLLGRIIDLNQAEPQALYQHLKDLVSVLVIWRRRLPELLARQDVPAEISLSEPPSGFIRA
ncbi:type III secretion system chaperone [Verrucomicrobium sp. BvORR106]|uniref:type III secretion system chaperone n=1 Tax=Verrucomicrobium sp. BvORR106 TaxID=1403819 RepID=UPI00056E01F9|nr:type III secretion system chaperone [Verrucomicrobium sp. BvORR106]